MFLWITLLFTNLPQLLYKDEELIETCTDNIHIDDNSSKVLENEKHTPDQEENLKLLRLAEVTESDETQLEESEIISSPSDYEKTETEPNSNIRDFNFYILNFRVILMGEDII